MSPPTANGIRAGTNPFLIAAVVGMAAFMEVLDISIANVSLRNIAGSLSATQEESTWVLTSYLVANAIVLPMSGWFSMLIGRKRFYLLSIGIFTVSSLMCGLAPTLPMLIFFRVLQGLGGGGLQPVSQAILADAFPPKQRGMAFAIYGMSVVAAPAIGPTLGGWITDNFSWHWIFLINVPVGVLLVALTRMMISDPPAFTEAREKQAAGGFSIDYVGFGLLALGLGALQIVLDKGQQEDWLDSNFIVTLSSISALALLTAIFWELRQKNPVINLHLFRDRNFAVGNLLMFMLGFVLLGSTLLLPLMVQTLMGYTATDAGLVISPGGFAILLLMPVVGALVTRVDPRLLIGVGVLTVGGAMFHMTGFTLTADYPTLAWARVYQTIGLAFLFIPINTVAFANLDPAQSGNGSALVNLARNVGGSVGISVLTTQLSRQTQVHQTMLGEHINPYNPEYHAAMQPLIERAGEPAATGIIARLVEQQAAMLAFIDNFWMLGVVVFSVFPLLFLLKRGAAHSAGPAH